MKHIKGQIAIEYILFLAILLLFFQAIVYPNVNFSENVIKDVYGITQTKQSMDKLVNDVSTFASTPGYGARTIYLYLPDTAQIVECDNVTKKLKYTILISNQEPKPNISACDRNTNLCTFNLPLFVSDADITCEAIGPGFNGYLQITKSNTGDLDVSRP